MTYEARREYLEAIKERYQKSKKKQKGLILDEFTKSTGHSRKYAIRILNGSALPRMRRPGPKSKYLAILPHLQDLWEVLDRPCSKKLVVAIPDLVGHYHHPNMSKEKEQKLKSISSSTIDRLLKPVRKGFQKGKSGTKPLNWMKAKIPLELLNHKITKPGYFEGDTVHHCGESLRGLYVSTLTMTDIASTWTENRAFWGRHGTKVLEKLKDIESSIPFPMWAFASDNGSEMLNDEIYRYLRKDRKNPVKMVRRRPYKKNDNAHVEQKNYTHVRQLFGYDRLDDQAMVAIMNEIYCAYWNKLQNFFIPTTKLIERTRVGGRIRKKYDKPKTPFSRILENDEVPIWVKRNLIDQKKGYNPFKLKAALDERMREFIRLVEHARIRRKFLNKVPA